MRLKLVERYIIKTVLAAILLVISMLTGLQIFILFVNQIGDLGKGEYGIAQAVMCVLLGTPYQVYLFFPMASLLGGLIGLGIMANHRELVVMRAAGLSIGQVTFIIFKVAVILIMFMTLLGEIVLPKLVLLANEYKIQAMSAGQALRTAQGFWLRHHDDFIAIGQVYPSTLKDIQQFHFNEAHQLQYIRYIQTLNYVDGHWLAHGIETTELQANRTKTYHQEEMIWELSLKPRLLNISSNEPDEMTLPELHQFIKIQQLSHQVTQNYKLVYWQRIAQPFTTMVMMMLAIPFIFGPLRSSTMGSKLLLGATVGFGFYIMNHFLGSLSQIYQFSSMVAALGPTVICGALGVYLMKRVH